jgi:glycosyltransferase involved in cell wall biosynthesis
MNLVFVIDNLSTGGAQRQLINLSLGLTQRGHHVEIFCYAPGDLLAPPLIDANIPIHWMVKQSRFSSDVILALRRLIHRNKPDLVLSFMTTPNFYAILAGLSMLPGRLPVVVSERFCDLPQGVSRLERGIRQFYRFSAHVVTNSHHQRINLQNRYPWLLDRISTIYNGYDLDYFRAAENEPNNNPLRILTIASVSPYKNGLCLIEALNVLRQSDGFLPKVDWIGQRVMRGERLEYLQKMETAIAAYGLQPQWQWRDQRTDIVDQLHQHDVLVHPSYGEGLPNVVCEAMSCARPVILSDILDHAQLVTHGENGFLFNHLDPKDLAEKILHFNELSIEERKKMGQAGRRFAEANLSRDRLVDEYERLFIDVTTKTK